MESKRTAPYLLDCFPYSQYIYTYICTFIHLYIYTFIHLYIYTFKHKIKEKFFLDLQKEEDDTYVFY